MSLRHYTVVVYHSSFFGDELWPADKARQRCRLTVFVYIVPACVAVLGQRCRLTMFVYSVPVCVLLCQGGGGAG